MARTGVETAAAAPGRGLTVLDGAAVIVGVVVGVGLFRTPPLIAGEVDSAAAYLGLWVLGGLITLAGALCYAELGSSHPGPGGEYGFLTRAFGRPAGLMFGWARGAVIQTGSAAVVAFVFGDYAHRIAPLGPFGPAIYAALAVAGLTALNLAGRRGTTLTQRTFAVAVVLALAGVVTGALAFGLADAGAAAAAATPAEPRAPGGGAIGLAMIFVLLTYGGWNEAAYLSGEVAEPRRDMTRMLVLGVALVTGLYLAVNAAYLSVLGLEGLRASDAPAAALMEPVLGPAGAAGLSLLVCVAALGTLNATLFTGARVYYALGRDVPFLRKLGVWSQGRENARAALLLQGAVALALVGFGATARDGFEAMVDYTAPVFWLFMALIGLSVFVLRRKPPAAPEPFRTPLFPLAPLIFTGASVYLFWSSLNYAGAGSLLGLAVLLAGVPFVWAAARGSRVTG